MKGLVLSALPRTARTVEVVERKGLGHPDTICDAIAETLSRELSAAYLERFGTILHHNVDKALLCGGQASPALGGGRVDEPLDIYLAGRATARAGAQTVPVHDVAVQSARRWLSQNLHALDVDRHVRIHPVLRPGSLALRGLFDSAPEVPLANDTSIGVGYAPLTPLEELVRSVEQAMVAESRSSRSAWGEDIKIMGVRTGAQLQLTISCALIGTHLHDMAAYLAEKAAIAHLANDMAAQFGFTGCEIFVNAADDPGSGQIYLTVTGTSAEAGDDGQVGRGNRINGLITPGRPMSLEAAAGKNPVTHVGKLYNVAAQEIARRIAASPMVERAECLLVSRIGAPISEPAVIEVKLEMAAQVRPADAEPLARDAAEAVLSDFPRLTHDLVAGRTPLF